MPLPLCPIFVKKLFFEIFPPGIKIRNLVITLQHYRINNQGEPGSWFILHGLCGYSLEYFHWIRTSDRRLAGIPGSTILVMP